MRIEIDIQEAEARALMQWLNSEHGMRARAAADLLTQPTIDGTRWMSRVVNGLGTISRALSGALAALKG